MTTADDDGYDRFEPSAESVARWEAYRALRMRQGEPDPDQIADDDGDDDPIVAEVEFADLEPPPAPEIPVAAATPARGASDLPPIVQRLPRDRRPGMAALIAWPVAAAVGFFGGLMAMNTIAPHAAGGPLTTSVASVLDPATADVTGAPPLWNAATAGAGAVSVPVSAQTSIQPLTSPPRAAAAVVTPVAATVTHAAAPAAQAATTARPHTWRRHVRPARRREASEDWAKYGYISH
jgi:hypothetical protein